MEYRILGKTGLSVSALSFGASTLGGVYGAIDETDAIRTVYTAIDLGINFIDTSPYYGVTKAETVLGKALKGIPRSAYILSTKVGRYDVDRFDFSVARVIASVEESLLRLNVEMIDIIHCHDIEFGSFDQIIHETIPALRKLQDQGKVCFVGITGLPLNIFPNVADRVEVDTMISYCKYCLNDTSLEDIIPYLKSKDIGIINASPLAMGLLTGNPAPAWHPASDAIKIACLKAADYCQSKGVDIIQLALSFCVSHPDIATTLTSTASSEAIKRSVRWAETPLDEALLAEVQAILAPIHNQSWPSGRPENNLR